MGTSHDGFEKLARVTPKIRRILNISFLWMSSKNYRGVVGLGKLITEWHQLVYAFGVIIFGTDNMGQIVDHDKVGFVLVCCTEHQFSKSGLPNISQNVLFE